MQTEIHEEEMTLAELEGVERLSKDLLNALRKSGEEMTRDDVRCLVDMYYQVQEFRKASKNQARAHEETEDPHELVAWFGRQFEIIEGQIKRALDAWTEQHEVCRWAKSIYGVGPVISAGLAAHIDIEQCPTVGHIWAFAGVAGDGQKAWGKKEKRPWNANLKTLVFKIGDCFVKFSGNEKCFYGHVYQERRAYEAEKNEAGDYAEQAEAGAKRVKKNTEAFKHYSEGKLPPGHLHARARRYAAKLFLAHWHEVAYEAHHGTKPPLPYPIAQLGRAHKIDPPNSQGTR